MNKRKIKILRILNRYSVGGPIYNAVYLTKYLDKNKYSTLLVGGKPEFHEKSAEYILKNEKINYKKLHFMHRSINPIYDFLSLISILIIIFNYQPDIVHTHAAKSGLIGRFACFISPFNIRVVHTYHGNVFEGYFNSFFNFLIIKVERFLAKFTDKIIAISKTQKNDLVNKYKICKKDKIEVIHLGFNLDKFDTDIISKRKAIRTFYNFKQNDIVISIIGRIVPIKNHSFFIDVFDECKKRTNFSIKALIIGDGKDKSKLIEYAKLKNLKVHIEKQKDIQEIKDFDICFCSWKKNIDFYMAGSEIISLTSINEGTPVSIIEAMASGTSTISTNVGGVSDIISNGTSGLIVENNINSYCKSLITLIENNELRDKLAKNAKKISKSQFDYKILVKNIEKLYDSLSRI